MSNRTNIAAASKNIVFVPLDKLKKSPKNVRKVPHTKADIEALRRQHRRHRHAAISGRRAGDRAAAASRPAIIWSMPGRAAASRNCFASSARRSRPTSRSAAFSTPSTTRPRSALPRTPIRSRHASRRPVRGVRQAARRGRHERRGHRGAVRRHRSRGQAAPQARRGQPQADGALPQGRNESRPAIRLRHHRGSRAAGAGVERVAALQPQPRGHPSRLERRTGALR